MAKDRVTQNDLIDEAAIEVWGRLGAELEKARKKLLDLMRTSSDLGGALKNSTQIKDVNEKIKALTKNVNNLNRVERALVTASNKTAASQTKVASATSKASKAMATAGGKSKAYGVSLKALLSTSLRFIAIYASIQKVGQALMSVYRGTKQLQALDYSMKIVIQDSKELANTQEFLRRIIENYGLDLFDTTRSYVKFTAAAHAAGIESKVTQKIFDSFAKSSAVLGLSQESVNSVFLALEQMLSKGKVTTEELRRQLGEHIPGAFNIMANAIGVSVSKLDEMLKKSQVLSADALPKMAAELERTIGAQQVTKVETLVAAEERMITTWRRFIEELEASGKLIQILDGMNEGFKRIMQTFGYFLDTPEKGTRRMNALISDISSNASNAAEELVSLKDLQKGLVDDIETAGDEYWKMLENINAFYKLDGGAYFNNLEDLDKAFKENPVKWEKYVHGRFKILYGQYSSLIAQEKVVADAISKNWERAYVEGLGLKGWETKELERWDKMYEDSHAKSVNENLAKENDAATKKHAREQVLRIDAIKAELARRRKLNDVEDKDWNDKYNMFKSQLDREYESYREHQEDLRRVATQRLIESTNDEKEIEEGKKALSMNMETNLTEFRIKQRNRLLAFTKGHAKEHEQVESDLAKISADYAKKNADFKIEQSKRAAEAYNEAVEAMKDADISTIEADTAKRISELSEKYTGESKSFKYSFQFDDSERSFAMESLQIEIDAYDDLMAVQNLSFVEYKRIEEEKFKLKQRLEQMKRDENALTAEREAQKLQETLQFVEQSINTMFGIFSDFTSARLEQAEVIHEHEINLAGDNTDQKLAAENKYEKEKRKLRKRQAIADKASAVFNIILNTLLGVASAASNVVTIPLIPFIKALGAIQLAAAIATPIPSYEKGGHHEGGPARFSEHGKREIFIPDGGGAPILTPAKETVADMPPGTFISNRNMHTALEKEIMLSITGNSNSTNMGETNSLLRKISNKEEINYANNTKVVKKSRIFGKYATWD